MTLKTIKNEHKNDKNVLKIGKLKIKNICFINLSMITNYLKIKIIALYNRAYFMLSKVNDRRLSVNKYLYLEKLLSTSKR